MILDPESTIIGIGGALGLLSRPGVSVARAPKNEHPSGRARCLRSSMIGLSGSPSWT